MVASSTSIESGFPSADALPRRPTTESLPPKPAEASESKLACADDAAVINDAIEEQVARANRWRFLPWDEELRTWQRARQQQSQSLPISIDANTPASEHAIERPWLITQGGFVSGLVHALCVIVLGTISWSVVQDEPWAVVVTPEPEIPEAVEITLPELSAQGETTNDLVANVSLTHPTVHIPGVSLKCDELRSDSGNSSVGQASSSAGAQLRHVLSSEGADAATHGERDGGAQFFGSYAVGRRFVFVVDCSMSMKGRKWTIACEELLRAIELLGDERHFYVIFFDRDSHRMFAPGTVEQTLVPATEQNVRRFRKWATTFQLGYETEPFYSMRQALDFMPDAIYLLSDGDFSDPTAAYLRKHNFVHEDGVLRMPAVAIHTIGLHDREGQKVLMRIAKENRGTYRFVPDSQ